MNLDDQAVALVETLQPKAQNTKWTDSQCREVLRRFLKSSDKRAFLADRSLANDAENLESRHGQVYQLRMVVQYYQYSYGYEDRITVPDASDMLDHEPSPPTDFQEGSWRYPKPGTSLDRKECFRCDGDGTLVCQSCDGRGDFPCRRCSQRGGMIPDGQGGQMACPDCGGTQRYTCRACGGAGEFECGKCVGYGYFYSGQVGTLSASTEESGESRTGSLVHDLAWQHKGRPYFEKTLKATQIQSQGQSAVYIGANLADVTQLSYRLKGKKYLVSWDETTGFVCDKLPINKARVGWLAALGLGMVGLVSGTVWVVLQAT